VKLLVTAVVAVTLPALAAGATAPTAPSPSGLIGRVLLDPGYPVCQVGKPCTRPAANVRLVFARGAQKVGTRTRADGTYRIRLKPGRYVVTSPSAARGRGLVPRRVDVPSSRYRLVVFRLDVGIR
jgi:hypothetical protein